MLDPKIVTAWLLTYLLHSTLFLALAWLAARGPLRRRPALEEAAWRFALMAALVTASVQLAAGYTPLAGRWGLAAPASAAVSAPADALPDPMAIQGAGLVPPAGRIALRRVEAATVSVARPAAPVQPFPWAVWIAVLWMGGAVALGARWLAAHLYLSRRLRARPEVIGGDMHVLLRRLTGEAGLDVPVRLSCSSRLPVPIALGLRRREICVPPRALASLSPEQQEGMLAHELAHLVRRDPFWLAFSHFLSSVLFFQPLNQVARRRLREISELRSDEWAVGQTGRPLSLARCLAEVAGWSIQPLGSLVAPGMADRPSHLAHRIRRLLDDARSPEHRVRPLWMAAGMAVLLVAVVAAAPSVAPAAPSPSAPAVVADPVRNVSRDQDPRGHDREERAAPSQRPEAAPRIAMERDADEAEAPEPEDAVQLYRLNRTLEASLAEADAQLANVYDREHLSEEEARALDEQLRAVNEQIERELKPSLKEAEQRLNAVMKEFENSAALKNLEARAKEIEQRYHGISDAEMAKIAADAEKMAAEAGNGRLTEEQREKIRTQAHEMAERSRLSDKDRAELDELTRQVREEQQRFMKEHAVEIETMRKHIHEQAAAMREEIRRQLESNPELKALIERRRSEIDSHRGEMDKHRDEMRRKRDEDRKKRDEERERRRKKEKDEDHDHSGAVSGGVRGGVPGGISGGVAGGVAGGVVGGVAGGVQ
jgi:beta-lactamase regulating signal transducer with metallopeptidase domain